MARVLLALFLIAPAALAQGGAETFRFPDAGLSVELPEGFYLAQILEEHFPDTALFAFQDDTRGEGRVRLLHVELHTYFSAEQRAAWGSEEEARSRVDPALELEPVDPVPFPLTAGAAYRVGAPLPGRYGYALFGCDDARCYRVDAVGSLEGDETPEEAASALLRGVRFSD